MRGRWVVAWLAVAGCTGERLTLSADAMHCQVERAALPAAAGPHGPGSWVATCGREVYDCEGERVVTCEPHVPDGQDGGPPHVQLDYPPPVESPRLPPSW